MPERDLASLISVQQAIQIIDAMPVELRQSAVPLAEAAGLWLGQDVIADRDYPPFRKSLMDGYAVHYRDATSKAELRVVGEIPAGTVPSRALAPGETMAIMTGAPLPDGADAVVPVEEVESRVGPGGVVRVVRGALVNQNIAAQGSDCPAGKVVLTRGTLIGAAQIAVLATVGVYEPLCHPRPKVAVIGTGNEIVGAGQNPSAAQIRDSNTYMLAALLKRLGCDVADVSNVPDEPEHIRSAIARGMAHDALFITGGMSMGEFDYVPRILGELGVESKVTKLRIKPGKPFVFGVGPDAPGRVNPPFVFGLPGNPVSAFVCTIRLASRLLSRLAGGVPMDRWVLGRLEAGLPVNGPREFYQPAFRAPATADHSAHTAFAKLTPLGWKGSADLFTLATANSLIVRSESEPPVPKGTVIRVLDIG